MTNRFNKLALSMTATLLAIVLLVGCGSGGGGNAGQASNGDKKSAGEKQTLKIYLDSSNMPEVFDEINSRFAEEYPDITLELEPVPEQSQYDVVFKTKVATGEVPDIFMLWPGEYTERYAGQNLLLDLTDKPYMKDVLDQAKLEASLGDKVYSLPVAGLFLGMFYNIDLFDQHGLKAPTTWNEFLSVSQTLKDKGITPIAMPFKEPWAGNMFMRPAMSSIMYPQKPDFDDDIRTGKDKYTNEQMVEILTKFVELKDKGYFIKDALGVALPQAQALFANGQAAMYLNGSWELPSLLSLNPELKLGMFPLPVVDSEDKIVSTSMMEYGLGAYKDTKVPEAVDKYLSFFTRTDIYEIFINGNKGMSTMKTVNTEANPTFAIMQEYVNNGRTHKFPVMVPGTADDFYKMQQEVYGGKPIEEALATFQELVDKKLKELQQ